MKSRARQLYDAGFSARANAIAHNRLTAKNGKIEQRLGKKGPFTEEFKDIIRSNYLGIYEHPHLDRELKGAKMILRALHRDKRLEAKDLLHRMTAYPVERKEPCLLCPVWRYEQAVITLGALALRYFFEAVRRELHFTTVVFGYAKDLFQLEDLIVRSRTEIDGVHRKMSRRRMGLVMAGALEADLRSVEDIEAKPLLRTLSREHKWEIADHGGWVLSGHFLTRAPHHDVFNDIMNDTWPSSSPDRVEMKHLYKDKSIEASIMETFEYILKYTGPLFDRSGENRTKAGSAKTFRSVQNAFFGPSVNKYRPTPEGFDREAALAQWALFVDRLGYDKFYYNVETAYAQKWFSDSEMAYFKKAGDFDWVHGWKKIELHRDTGPYSNRVDPKVRHLVPRRRTRPLTIDIDWVERTDFSGADPFTNPMPVIL